MKYDPHASIHLGTGTHFLAMAKHSTMRLQHFWAEVRVRCNQTHTHTKWQVKTLYVESRDCNLFGGNSLVLRDDWMRMSKCLSECARARRWKRKQEEEPEKERERAQWRIAKRKCCKVIAILLHMFVALWNLQKDVDDGIKTFSNSHLKYINLQSGVCCSYLSLCSRALSLCRWVCVCVCFAKCNPWMCCNEIKPSVLCILHICTNPFCEMVHSSPARFSLSLVLLLFIHPKPSFCLHLARNSNNSNNMLVKFVQRFYS